MKTWLNLSVFSDEKKEYSLMTARKSEEAYQSAKPIPTRENLKSNHCSLSMPLHSAALRGHAGDLEDLLKQGESVDAINEDCETPLQVAIQEGHLDVCRLLLEYGAKVDCADNNQRTPLHMAAQEGLLDVCRLLVEYGAKVDCADKNQKTPLHMAAHRGHYFVCKFLLKKGAKGGMDILDKDNKTPLDSESCNNHEITKWFLRDSKKTLNQDENLSKTASQSKRINRKPEDHMTFMSEDDNKKSPFDAVAEGRLKEVFFLRSSMFIGSFSFLQT